MSSRNTSKENNQSTFLEIAIFNSTSAQIAYTSSADRLELCGEGSSANGGTTPSLSTLQMVISSLQQVQSTAAAKMRKSIPVYAMIRPRGGDFVYSDEEFGLMKEQLLALKSASYSPATGENETDKQGASSNHDKTQQPFFEKVSGFVFGILTKENKFDRVRNEGLVKLAAPLPCTFHRAFDEVITSCQETSDVLLSEEVVNELEAVIKAGFASILTSGGTGQSAVDGARQIAALTEAAKGRIEIIAGGGVRSTNVRELRIRSPLTRFFHSSAIVDNRDVADGGEVLALKSELSSN